MKELDFRHLHVEFYLDAVLDEAATKREGRPIYKDEERVKIMVAGDNKNVLVAPAHDQSSIKDEVTGLKMTYAQLHAGPYKAFREGVEFVGVGTPLKELPFLTESRRRELAALNIKTAEALAELDGAALGRLGMNGRELKNQARDYIEAAKGSASLAKIVEENELLKRRLEALEKRAEEPEPASPFSDWSDEDIRLWIEENGGEKLHHKCSRATILKAANALNEKAAA